MITLTESAAKELISLINRKGLGSDTGLRLSVEKGGCAGMQYVMEVGSAQTDDVVSEQRGAKVFMAKDSMEYLDECEVYYEFGLTDSGFKIRNPNAARSCGCGTSFEAKGEEGTYDPANDCK